MKLNDDQFDEDEKLEEEGILLNRFNGQPVVCYNMGQEDEYVQATSAEYSKYCHPYINLVYGYRNNDDQDVLIIREHVHGKNYYTLSNYKHLGDRLIGFYKCVTIIEYIHSFRAVLRMIRPEKFIMSNGLSTVKLVDVIKHDNRLLTKIQNSTKLPERNAKYICPELYEEDLSDNSLERGEYEDARRSDLWTLGCMLYYAITKKDPWEGYTKREDILAEYRKTKEYGDGVNKFFWKDEDLVGDDGKPIDAQLREQFNKLFDKDNLWEDDLTKFREELETRPNINAFISEQGGDLEMDYHEGNYKYLYLL